MRSMFQHCTHLWSRSLPCALVLCFFAQIPAASAHSCDGECGGATCASDEPQPWTARATAEFGRFLLESGAGSWALLDASLDGSVTSRVRLAASVPVVRIRYDGGTTPLVGIGDVSLRVDVTAFDSERAAVHARVEFSLPTGSASDGLGMGHFMIFPAVDAGFAPAAHWWLSESTTLLFSVEAMPFMSMDDDGDNDAMGEHVHGAVYAQHAHREGVETLRARYAAGLWDVTPAATITVFENDAGLNALLTGGAEVGARIQPHVRLAAGGYVPIAGPARYAWKLRSSVQWEF